MSLDRENVRDFIPKERKAPAIGVSIVMNIPGEKQVTLQTFVAQEDSLEDQCQVMDRMQLLADRQRAKYMKVDWEAELVSKQDEIKFRIADMARQKVDHTRKIEAENEKIAAFKDQMETTNKEGYEQHIKDGRSGPYTPKGARLSQINACSLGVKQAEENIKKFESEWLVTEQSIQTTIDACNSKIEQLKSAIAHAEKVIGG